MNELYDQLLFYVNSIWQRRWYALTVAWLLCAVGWGIVVAKPNTYTSRSQILIDTATVLRPLLEGLTVESDLKSELEVMKQTLTSSSNLAKVARMTDLDISAATPTDMERLLDSIKARTKIQTEGRYFLSISFVDTDPVRARDVVQAFTKVFIETNLGASRQEMESARQFVDRQIQAYEVELEKAEQRLAQFKKEKLGVLPDQVNYGFRIETLRNDLTVAEAELQRTLLRRDKLRRDLEAGPISNTTIQIFELEHSLEEMLTRFTERHPDVVAMRRKLDALGNTTQVGTQAAPLTADDATEAQNLPGSFGISMTDYEQAKSDLLEEEANVAIFRDRVSQLRARLSNLERSAAQIPIVEAQLAKLNRDYDVMRLKHAELLSRREKAKISRQQEVGGEGIQFQVVEPPRIPAIPDGPSRIILLTAVLVVGIGAGVAFSIVLAFVNENFSNPVQLRQAFPFPVFGTVTPIASVRQHTWQAAKSSVFAVYFVLLFAAYGGLFLVETQVGWASLPSVEFLKDLYMRVSSGTEVSGLVAIWRLDQI